MRTRALSGFKGNKAALPSKPCAVCGQPMGWRKAWAKYWAEVAEESGHVWSSQPRTAMFPAAMRHFAESLRAAGQPLDDRHLDETAPTLADELAASLRRHRPRTVVMTAPGDWRVLQTVRRTVAVAGPRACEALA